MLKIVREARPRKAHLVFLDESGFMLTPTVRRTLAPRDKAPILKSWYRHDRISALGAVTVIPKQRRLGLDFRLLPDDVNAHGEDTVAFLKKLKRQIPGPMTILWGRSNIHDRSTAVWVYLAEHPEMNRDETVWEHTKPGRLSHFTPEDTAELRAV